MDIMPDFRAPSNPDPRPLPTLAEILAQFDRIGYRKPEPRPLPPLADILAHFDRIGAAAPRTEGGSL